MPARSLRIARRREVGSLAERPRRPGFRAGVFIFRPRGAAVGCAMRPSKTALFEAAKRWDAAAVSALLKAAPELAAATDQRGRTALHLACSSPPGPKQGEPNGIRTAT